MIRNTTKIACTNAYNNGLGNLAFQCFVGSFVINHSLVKQGRICGEICHPSET